MDEPSIDFFIGLEREVWEALAAGDAAADTALLSDDFVGVYPTGFADRTAHAAELDDGPTVTEYELSDTSLLRLTDDHVVLSYAARYRRPTDSDDQTMYVSSIWSRRDGAWINTFSQDTPAALS